MTTTTVAALVWAAAVAPAGAQEAAPAPPPPAVEPHGLLQLQYRAVLQQGAPSPLESGALLRRARVSVDGFAYLPALRYRAELSFDQGTVAPLDLFAGWSRGHWSVYAGQFRVPSSRVWTINDGRLAFPERSIATEEFRYDYDVGALATLAFDHVSGSFGVFNGAGKNVVANDNVDPLFFARVAGSAGPVWNAAEGDIELTRPPSLNGGISATLDYVPIPAAYGYSSGEPVPALPIPMRDTDGNGRTDGVRVLQLALDLSLHWRGLAFEAEGYYRRESWRDIGSLQPAQFQFSAKPNYTGFYAQALWAFLAGRYETGARASITQLSPLTVDGRVRPAATCIDLNAQAFPCAVPFTSRRSELSLVAIRHWWGHGVQATVFYSLLGWRADTGAPLPYTREQRIVGQAQLAF